jgi:thiol-disulfide isomerase/thioredoxin
MFLLSVIVFVVSCSDKQSSYEIKGTVPDSGLNGCWVFMSDYNEDQVVDSALIEKGQFIFKGKIDGSAVRNLNLQYLSVDLIVEKGAITVDMSDPYSAKGSPLTEELNKFNKENEELINNARTLMNEIGPSLSDEERALFLDSISDDLYEKLNAIPPVYLKDHSDDALGDIVFYVWMENMESNYENYESSSKLVSERVLNFLPTKELFAIYDKKTQSTVGQPFIDFTIENGNIDGSSVSLSDYVGKGKYVLVDFWASWCMPCREEIPNLKDVYSKYKGENFEMVSIAVWDKREDTMVAIKDEQMIWPQIVDAKTIPSDLYAIRGIPTIILFGPDGKILSYDLRGADIKTELAKIMGK